jgi:hypothetical protein
MDTMTWILVGLGALLAIGGFAIVWARRGPQEEDILHFNCPGCGRKLRYRPRQAGHSGKCPRCGGLLTFPGMKVKK